MNPGLYEQIINKQLNKELQEIPNDCKYQEKVDPAEASKVLSAYVAELLQRKMDVLYESLGEDALDTQIEFINRVIGAIEDGSQDQMMIEQSGEQLISVMSEKDDRLILGKKAKDIVRPETSVAFSNLFTGAVREPQMLTELKKEIASADRIDMLVSFIKWSGLRELLDELTEFTHKGGKLRVI